MHPHTAQSSHSSRTPCFTHESACTENNGRNLHMPSIFSKSGFEGNLLYACLSTHWRGASGATSRGGLHRLGRLEKGGRFFSTTVCTILPRPSVSVLSNIGLAFSLLALKVGRRLNWCSRSKINTCQERPQSAQRTTSRQKRPSDPQYVGGGPLTQREETSMELDIGT